jgi:hypothetical protein
MPIQGIVTIILTIIAVGVLLLLRLLDLGKITFLVFKAPSLSPMTKILGVYAKTLQTLPAPFTNGTLDIVCTGGPRGVSLLRHWLVVPL